MEQGIETIQKESNKKTRNILWEIEKVVTFKFNKRIKESQNE